MKKIGYLLFTALSASACEKNEAEKVDFPNRIAFAYEIVGPNEQSVFQAGRYNPDSTLLKVLSPANTTADIKPDFRNVDGRFISRTFAQPGILNTMGERYTYVAYVYLSKKDTDTLQIIHATYTLRDLGAGPAKFPTYMAFYYNGHLSAEYDFVAHPELLSSFWANERTTQIVTLRKK